MGITTKCKNSEKKFKKVLLATFLGPYLLLGIFCAIQFFFLWNSYVEHEKIKILQADDYVIENIAKQIERLEYELKQGTFTLNNDVHMQAMNVKKEELDEDYRIKYNATNVLNDYYMFNSLVEDIVVFYSKNDTYIKKKSVRTVPVMMEEYGITGITVSQMQKALEADYGYGELISIEKQYFYIFTIPAVNNGRVNYIYKLDEVSFLEIIENNQKLLKGNCVIKNSTETIYQDERIEMNDKEQYLVRNIYTDIAGNTYENHIAHAVFNTIYIGFFHAYMYLFVMYCLLLVIGIIIIQMKYNKIYKALTKLSTVIDNNQVFKTETDFVNNAISNITFMKKNIVQVTTDNAIKDALYQIPKEGDDSYDVLLEKYGENESNHFIVMILDVDTIEVQSKKEKELFCFIFENIFKEIFPDMQDITIIFNYDSYIIILNSKEHVDHNAYLNIVACVEKILIDLGSQTHYAIRAGISTIEMKFTKFPTLYEQAYQATSYCKDVGNARLCTYQEITNIENIKYVYTPKQRIEFINKLRLKQTDQAKELLGRILESNFEEKSISNSQGKLLILSIVNDIRLVAAERNIILSITIQEVFEGELTHEQLLLELDKNIDMLCVLERTETNADKQVAMIHQYISKEYTNYNLSVSLIAEVFQMNTSYLSRVYKEKTGTNLGTYIANYRVAKIKELLREKNNTITSVSDQCGFTNVNIMIRTFKKTEGVTPGQYREGVALTE